MSNQLSTIQFYGQPLITIEQGGKYYVAMRPVCDNIGLDWAGQFSRIKRDEVLNSTVVIITTVADDNKKREMLCLPIEYLNGWLFGIDIKRVRPEIRDILIRYKKECYQVLYNYWHQTGQYSTEYKTQPSDILTKEQQAEIRALVLSNAAKLPKEQRKVAIVQAWSKLKAHFKVPYRQIPQSEFSEAISIVQRTFTEWELVEDEHLPITQNKDTFTLSRDQAYDVLCVFSMACFMNDTIRYLEKPLRLLGNSRAGTLYSQGVEYQRSLLKKFSLFEEMLSQFPPEGGKHSPIYGYTGDWDRLHHCVMPNVRQALK